MNQIMNTAVPATMTSLEIAELTGKEHGHVMRDIRNMLEVLKKDASSFGGIYLDAYGREKPCFNLDPELTLTLVSGYDIPLRHRVVTRLAELEEQARNPIAALPDFTNPAAAARAWADQQERAAILAIESANQQKLLEVIQPKADALDRISASHDTVTITEAAKLLGMKRNDLTVYMHAHGWIYRQNGSWVAYDQYIKNFCLQYKEANYTDEKTNLQCLKPYCHITPKGLAKLALMLGAKVPSGEPVADQAV